MCLTVPPTRHYGGAYESRTRLTGSTVLCPTDERMPHLDWRRGGDSNTQFLAESHFQCDALPFCTPLQIAGGRGGSRTPMRLSPPFVSSEDLYHLGELFHQAGGARGIRTPKGFTPTSFQDWLHNQFEHRSISNGGETGTRTQTSLRTPR